MTDYQLFFNWKQYIKNDDFENNILDVCKNASILIVDEMYLKPFDFKE